MGKGEYTLNLLKLKPSAFIKGDDMQCNCGGSMEFIHKVVMDKKTQGEYQRCQSCGRISWLWQSKKLINVLTNKG